MFRFQFGLLWLLAFFASFDRMIPAAAFDAADPDAGETGPDIEEGRKFWSFQPLGQFKPPAVERDDWARSPIDRFILSRQEQERISPAAIAGRYKLIRRARFDLTGLPPRPEEVVDFVLDLAPDAYERLLDRLLASPQYGERWARHWLDLARFAESNGFEKDEDRPAAYHYRDFVIRSLNQDLPYDEFVQWQIAGDQLRPHDPLTRTATGFLVAGVENIVQSIKEFERDRYDKLDDMASTIGTTMLGLTIGCARCHDHKYDPISQRDYYRFVSSFEQTASREIMLGSQETGTKAYAAVDVGDEVRKVEKNFNVGTDQEKFVLEARVHFLERGDVNAKLEVATQSFPQVLMRGGFREDHWQKPTSANEQSPPPRVTLAHWITDVSHGAGNLLARVMVNRLWQHHMATGLVATPSDFGQRGERPTHPELLDWLASDLVSSGWGLKWMHRRMMASSVYMQTHRHDEHLARVDPENRLIWRRPLRRLEAEAIRNTMLATSGQLDRSMHGPGTLDQSSHRRSIYLTVKRTKLIPMLRMFDCPDALQGIGRRPTTTVAPQSLMLLNSEQVRAHARKFASRLDAACGSKLDRMIEHGLLVAFSRLPADEELHRIRRFVQQQAASYQQADNIQDGQIAAMTDLCQLLFCSNEFIYVE